MSLHRNALHLSLSTVIALALGTLLLCLGGYRHLGSLVTATAALGLLVGAIAGLFGRTWGIALVLASGVSFAGAAYLDMTNVPHLFWLLAFVGVVPFALTAPRMTRFDAAATAFLALLAAGAGIGSALAWRAVAPLVIPGLRS